MIKEIQKRWAKRYTRFYTSNNRMADVTISSSSEVGDHFAIIKAEITETSDTTGETRIIVPISMPPVRQAGGIVRLGNTFYNLANGLIQRDGFYLVKEKDRVSLQFIRKDKVLFNLISTKAGIKLHIAGNENTPIDTCSFLIGLDIFNSRDEFNYNLANIKHFFATKNTTMSKEELSRMIYFNLFGPTESTSFIQSLHAQCFDGFFGTSEVYSSKHIFFSYSRFIGATLVSSSHDSIIPGSVVDEDMALALDSLKVTEVTLSFKDGVEETITVNWEDEFTSDDLLNALHLMVLKMKHPEAVAFCDIFALYSKDIYSYYDYVTDYTYDRVQDFVKKQLSKSAYSPNPNNELDEMDFKRWVSKGSMYSDDKEKALSVVSANNSLTYMMNRSRFTKDLMRKNSNTIPDNERYLHPTFFGWVNPFITSDSKKVGLTGSFAGEVNVETLSRPFKVITSSMINPADFVDIDETADTSSEILEVKVAMLTPVDTFNKVIGFLERDGSYTTMLNGKFMHGWSEDRWDIYCEVDDLEDIITSIVPGLECDQPKRYRLSNKAIMQSLPMSSANEYPRKGLKIPQEDMKIGKTAKDIFQELAEIYSSLADLLASQGFAALQSMKIVSVMVGKHHNSEDSAFYSHDDKGDDTFYITFLIDNVEYIYRHPRYIQSPSESTRLYFRISKPENGHYFQPKEVIIYSGRVADVGQECNILYSCLDGGTYEDGITLTSNFARAMGLTTSLHFSETVSFEGDLGAIIPRKETPTYLDVRGLPRIGTFIRKGDLLCKLETPAIVTKYSNFTGFIETVRVNKKGFNLGEVKIYITELSVPDVGDKIGNGHGNKGVVVRVLPSYLINVVGSIQPDIIINPLGTIARMNVGQVKEMVEHSLSIASNSRIELASARFDQKDIKTLVKELQATGSYQEHSVIYNGFILENKAFVAPMVMYRMKQHNRVHLNYASRPDINVNHIAANGQRLSVLNTLLYSAYGCQDDLKYLMSYQSRTAKNNSVAENAILDPFNGDVLDDKFDSSVLRANAMHLARGQKITSDGPRIVTNQEISVLQVLPELESMITNSRIFGEADPRNLTGYRLTAKIQVGGPLIMPAVLEGIMRLIPYSYMSMGNREPPSETQYLNSKILKKLLGDYQNEKAYISINKDKSCLHVYLDPPVDATLVSARLGQGLFAFVSALSELDLTKVRNNLKDEDATLFDNIERVYGKDFINSFILDGIPVAPVNLRPKFKGRSGQDVDNLYRNLSRASNPMTVWHALKAIDEEFGIQLYQHNAVKPVKGGIAHGEKTSEYMDSLYARRYGYSGRSVATFDNSLEIYELSLPFELLYYELEPVVKRELLYNETASEKGAYSKKIDSAVKGFLSNTSYDKEIVGKVINVLEDMTKRIATGMTREPVLRRQNHFWYQIKINYGTSIKGHTAVCSGYNLDFDGDAITNILCLSYKHSDNLLRRMSPYEGLYDYDSGEVWLKPMQDSLLGLYKLTKFSPAEEINRIVLGDENTLATLKRHVKVGKLGFDTTVLYVHPQFGVLKQTVGNLILLLTIREDALLGSGDDIHIEPLLNEIKGGMTNKNNGKFIEKLVKSSGIFKGAYRNITSEHYIDFDKFHKLHVIRDIINLGYEVITINGVTLNPSTFANIKTADEVRSELGLKTQEFVGQKTLLEQLKSKEPPLYTLSRLSQEEQDVREIVERSIYKDPNLSDIFNSGCRGKIGDFIKVCDSIGKNAYGDEVRNIKSNYSKGLSYMDKMLLAQPDRKAVVNTQMHLGEQGAALQRAAVVASSIRITQERCTASPTLFYPEFNLFVKGKDLASKEFLEVLHPELLAELKPWCTEHQAEDNGYPAELVCAYIVKLGLKEWKGSPITYKLKRVDREIIKSHHVVIDHAEFEGSEVLNRIEEEAINSLAIYTLYNCEAEHGICRHCYGNVPNAEALSSFSGNVGVNTVFSVGQQAFQNTLDASKSTSGDIDAQSQSMLTIFQYGNICMGSNVIPAAELAIEYIKYKDTFKVVDGKDKSLNCLSTEVDVYYKEHEAFIPKRFVDFVQAEPCMSNEAKEYLYFNMLRLLSSNVLPQQADSVLATNMRYVINDGIEPLSALTRGLPRHWVTNAELYGLQDPLISPLLPSANDRFTRQALSGRGYDKHSIFYGVLSIEDIDTIKSLSAKSPRVGTLLTLNTRPQVQELPESYEEVKELPDYTECTVEDTTNKTEEFVKVTQEDEDELNLTVQRGKQTHEF